MRFDDFRFTGHQKRTQDGRKKARQSFHSLSDPHTKDKSSEPANKRLRSAQRESQQATVILSSGVWDILFMINIIQEWAVIPFIKNWWLQLHKSSCLKYKPFSSVVYLKKHSFKHKRNEPKVKDKKKKIMHLLQGCLCVTGHSALMTPTICLIVCM